jgi:hypothetical protein
MKRVGAVSVRRKRGFIGQVLGRILFPAGRVWVSLVLASGKVVHKRIKLEEWFTPTFGVRNCFFRYSMTHVFFTMYRARGTLNYHRKGKV